MERKYPGNLDEIRRASPNAYGDWSPDEDAQLIEGQTDGLPVAELARRFGRGSNAVRSRLRHLYALRQDPNSSED